MYGEWTNGRLIYLRQISPILTDLVVMPEIDSAKGQISCAKREVSFALKIWKL